MGTTRSLILVDRWRLKTKISALARRRIIPRNLVPSGTGFA